MRSVACRPALHLTFAEQDAKIDQRFGELRLEIAQMKVDLVRWMFAFWAGQFLALAAFMWVALRPR